MASLVKYINVCDTDNNTSWTMDNESLNDIVYIYSKQCFKDAYKLEPMIPIIASYVADRDCEWYTINEIVEESDEWAYCIGEVEDAGIKETFE